MASLLSPRELPVLSFYQFYSLRLFLVAIQHVLFLISKGFISKARSDDNSSADVGGEKPKGSDTGAACIRAFEHTGLKQDNGKDMTAPDQNQIQQQT